MQKRFAGLRFTANVLKAISVAAVIFAFLACGLAILASSAEEQLISSLFGPGNFVYMGSGGFIAGVMGALFILAGGLFSALCFYALGELILLLIAVEENTRAAALAAGRERPRAQNG